MHETLSCPAGHRWHARLRPAELGDCATRGVMFIVEGEDLCPECGLVAGGPAYCWTCDEELTPDRAAEIVAAADQPDRLTPRDFLCAAHAEDGAGDEVRPCETGMDFAELGKSLSLAAARPYLSDAQYGAARAAAGEGS